MRNLALLTLLIVSLSATTGCGGGRSSRTAPPEGQPDTSTNVDAVLDGMSDEKPQ